MHDHAKPTIRDFNPGHTILLCGTNDTDPDRASSQIAREIIDLLHSLKFDNFTVNTMKQQIKQQS